MNNNESLSKVTVCVFWCFAIFCGILAGAWVFRRPLIGDDLFYAGDLDAAGGGVQALPHVMAGIWTGCNSRWGDITNTVWLSLLPRFVTAAFAFIFAFLLPWTVVKLSGIGLRQSLPVALLTMAIVFLLPWWDMTHHVCMINYPWGAAIVLLCLIPLLYNCGMRSKLWIAGLPVAFMGGAWHEASGVPLVAGLLVWCLINRRWKHFTTIKKLWFSAMVAGCVFTISSPAIWHRAANTGVHDGSVAYLLLGSANVAVILLVVIITLTVSNRALLRRLLNDNFTVFAIASLLSACIVAVGGVEGRSGFFAQTFGVIALMRIYAAARREPRHAHMLPAIAAVMLYIGAGFYVADRYKQDLEVTCVLEQAIDTYPEDHETGYRLVMSTPGMEQWDAASLKVLDPRYDNAVDRNDSLSLKAEEK